jgi:hypothetical protein
MNYYQSWKGEMTLKKVRLHSRDFILERNTPVNQWHPPSATIHSKYSSLSERIAVISEFHRENTQFTNLIANAQIAPKSELKDDMKYGLGAK